MKMSNAVNGIVESDLFTPFHQKRLNKWQDTLWNIELRTMKNTVSEIRSRFDFVRKFFFYADKCQENSSASLLYTIIFQGGTKKGCAMAETGLISAQEPCSMDITYI